MNAQVEMFNIIDKGKKNQRRIKRKRSLMILQLSAEPLYQALGIFKNNLD